MTLAKLLTFALLALTLTACGGEDDTTNNATNNTTNNGGNLSAAAAAGKTVFEGTGACLGCHGADGKKVGAPGPANDSLTSAVIQAKSDAALFDSIKNGKGNMPPYGGNLSDEQISNSVAYIRTLK